MTQGNKRLLIVGDALEALKPASDSSLALAEAARGLGWDVHWCEPHDVGLLGREVVVSGTRRLARPGIAPASWTTHGSRITSLSSYDLCLIRKDPPFDEHYKDLCWLLSAQVTTPVVNTAEALLAGHEKALPYRAWAEGVIADENLIPTCVSRRLDVIEHFCVEQRKSADAFLAVARGASQEFKDFQGLRFIVKPWLGFAGHGVTVATSPQAVREILVSNTPAGARPEGLLPTPAMVQPFLPEIADVGDRRVIVACGEVICDFVRLPAPGKVASNLAQGGRAELRPMSDTQVQIVTRLALFLTKKGIDFAGIDLIGDKVGEINVTSPTGLRTYQDLTGRDVAHELFQRFAVKAAAHHVR